ncbi:putative AC transposase [Glycine soja]|uniref:Putative AC transposase n=1 Tax=Glycine soja TaxID=3848 RepID=A0A445FSW7_GLYSO|nr:putative AC transposase [Glycine soja]
MRTHLDICKKKPNIMTKRQKSNSSSTIITPSSSSMIDQEAYRIALVKLFMALELSFRMVEHEAFQEFVRIIAPSFVVISHTTLAWDILSLWSSEKMLQNKVIKFYQVKSHTGKNLARTFESCLSSWGLTFVLSLTLENSTSNDKAIEYLQKRLMSWNRLVLNGNYLHMCCCAHVISLIVQEGFKEDIAAICRVRVAIKHSRWNSTYLVLEAALKHQKAFEEFKLRDKKFMGMTPTYSDWESVHSILSFLEIFYDANLCIFGSFYVTSTMYMFEAFGIRMKIREMSTSRGGELTCKLRDKVESSLRSLFEKYNYGGDEFEVSSLEARARPSERVKNDPYGYSRYFQSTRSSTSKLDIYLEDASDSRLDLDVLNWWKLNSDRFPTFACMARDVLVIPISTMAFEFAFSIRGRVLDPYLCSLTPQMVEELVCTQDWIKRTPSPLPSNENEEFLEFKRIEEAKLMPFLEFCFWIKISCPLEWGAPTFDAGHAFGMVVAISLIS